MMAINTKTPVYCGIDSRSQKLSLNMCGDVGIELQTTKHSYMEKGMAKQDMDVAPSVYFLVLF